MSEEIANQSEESLEIERDAETEALFDSFGIAPKGEKKDVQFPNMQEPTDEEDPLTMEEEDESAPAESKKTFKYKYNGEEGEVDETEAPALIQKGMNYDKVQQKLTEQQKQLDEVAQLQGYKDHAELLTKLPELREQQKQKEQNAYNDLREDLRQQAEEAGLDPDRVDAYLNNHPLIKEALQAKQERENDRSSKAEQEKQQAIVAEWQVMYKDPRVLAAFPDIIEDSRAFDKQEVPKFLTPEMQARINKGYHPLDAILLSHADKFQGQSKKAAEQKIIKQQQLGMRAGIDNNTATAPDEAALLPAQIALAEEFGVTTKGIQRQNQLLKNRR